MHVDHDMMGTHSVGPDRRVSRTLGEGSASGLQVAHDEFCNLLGDSSCILVEVPFI